MSDPDRRNERRADVVLREQVDTAIAIGRKQGFVQAADFMHRMQVPRSIAYRLLAEIDVRDPGNPLLP